VLIWDDSKRRSNIAKHGVDFADLPDLDWTRAWVFEDRRRDYGEKRSIALVPLGRRLHAIVYTLARRRAAFHFGAQGEFTGGEGL
jgi:uncharacterized protein